MSDLSFSLLSLVVVTIFVLYLTSFVFLYIYISAFCSGLWLDDILCIIILEDNEILHVLEIGILYSSLLFICLASSGEKRFQALTNVPKT